MKISKKTFWNLIILFEIILVIKVFITLFQDRPFVFSDEPCALLRARHFAKTLTLESCKSLTNMPAVSPQPLYSIVLSPLYLFLPSSQAYSAALILNSILVSSLVFPLYSLFKKIVGRIKDNTVFVYIFLILSLSTITLYEKMVMTELLFIVLNVWFIYFYIKSFEKNKARNKIIAIIFSILASLTRPFGFLVPISLAINELIRSKKKKVIFLTILPLAIGLTSLTIFVLMPHAVEYIKDVVISLYQPNNWKILLVSLQEQVNSFTIGTFLMPLLVFFTYIFKDKSPAIKNIRYFLITFILLNFAISAQHIYQYFIFEEFNPNLITRYINMSIIFIFIFSFIFFAKHKKFTLTNSSIAFLILLLILLITGDNEGIRTSLNLDIASFYKSHDTLFGKDFSEIKKLFIPLFLTGNLIFLILLIKNKRKIIKIASSILIIIYFLCTTIWISNYVQKHPITEYFEDKHEQITLLVDNQSNSPIIHVWELLSFTDNNVGLILMDLVESNSIYAPLSEEEFESSQFYNDSKFVISTHEFDLPVILSTNFDKVKVYKKNQDTN